MIRVLVNIDVPDLEEGIAFYRDGVGLTLVRRLFDGTVAEMTGGGASICLLEKRTGTPAGAKAPAPRDYARHWTPVHLDFVVDDIETAVRRARAAGATLESEVQEYPWGRLILLADPFGHGFCLLRFSGKGYEGVPEGTAPPPARATRRRLSWLSPKTEVKESPIHGRGLFAGEPVARDEIVAIKGGAVFDAATRVALEERLGPAEIPVAEGFFIGPLDEADREGGMIFSNHSCEPNLGVKGQIVFVAMRDVEAGEELTHDWAMTDDEPDEMDCRCGALSCRGRITGRDWRRKDLQEKYRGYFSWYLQRKIAGDAAS